MKIDLKIFFLSLVVGLLLVSIDICLDSTLFYGKTVSIGSIDGIKVNELFMRIMILGAFIVFGAIVARLFYQRKRYEKKHLDDIIFLEQMINSIPAPVFYKDRYYVYTGCNQSFEKFLGKSRDMIIGKTVHEIAPIHLADIYHEKDVELMENPGVQVYESKVKKSDGKELNVIFHKATFLDVNGELDGMIGVILDITELRKTEADKERVIGELQGALAKVKVLSGFLPICSSCKKIRNDSGYWQRIEGYLREHSEAEFSHSICPDCSENLRIQYEEELLQEEAKENDK